ncbi:Molybdopterin synthase catalytic subunit [Tulasnella sp. 330]|nr:Molybdopterin synthase catalytic subunit [Tulasnella sp. 330]KAG8876366.1 Molybdopterin synthase catalytic subunit [Tulasnella sp. 331]KAG8884014.1 Molybdopterin synthase catalytic subunit [Tulasnella sp. 332]
MSDAHPSDGGATLQTHEGDTAVITFDVLDPSGITRSVQSHQAGAFAIFIGTTRDNFRGRKVTRLEYEAYTPLALKTMGQILTEAHQLDDQSSQKVPEPTRNANHLIRCTVHHRIGVVPVGEASIVIAVSSPHRKEAFQACEFILEEVKLKAQIWKREWYEGDDVNEASWKENFPALRKDGEMGQ